jgi:hypothetical protein
VVRSDVTWYARRLAADLGAAGQDPVEFILGYAERQIRAVKKKHRVGTLSDLLAATAQEVGTCFEGVSTDEELDQLVVRYTDRGETAFAQLPNDFRDSFGVTLRLINRRPWELAHVSVIDCRGSKAYRAFFTKWHELAHLLVLTRQAQFKFRRTHAEKQAADEALMDMIAARFGYWSDILQPHLVGKLTFETLGGIKSAHCPESSWQSFVHAAIDRWPTPAVYLKAEPRLKRAEERQLNQSHLWSHTSAAKLRLSDVIVNDSARSRGADLFPNMRVPQTSILHRIHSGEVEEDAATECLSLWESSARGPLRQCEIAVVGRSAYEGVEGLISFD